MFLLEAKLRLTQLETSMSRLCSGMLLQVSETPLCVLEVRLTSAQLEEISCL